MTAPVDRAAIRARLAAARARDAASERNGGSATGSRTDSVPLSFAECAALLTEVERLEGDVSMLATAHDMWQQQWKDVTAERDALAEAVRAALKRYTVMNRSATALNRFDDAMDALRAALPAAPGTEGGDDGE